MASANTESLFDIILSGSYNQIHKYDERLLDYLPRLTFYATYCWPSLFKSLYHFPEVNRIQSCFEIDPDALLTSLQQSVKSHPVDSLLFSTTLINDQSAAFHQSIEHFEKGTPAEQMRILCLELYQLSRIFHYKISDDRVDVPDTNFNIPADDTHQSKKKREKNQEKLEERKRKKREKDIRQAKIALKQQAALRLPILSSPTYSSILSELVPCIPFIIPQKNRQDEAALTIPNIALALLLSPCMGKNLLRSLTLNHPSSLESIITVLLANISLFPSLIQETLNELCLISAVCAKLIREQLTVQQKLPEIVLQITSELLHDEITYLSCLLSQCGWLKGCLRRSSDIPIRQFLHERIISYHAVAEENTQLTSSVRLDIISLLRIYCTIMNTFLSDKEVKGIIQLLLLIEFDANIAQLGLSFMLVCEGLLNLVDRDLVSKLMMKILQSNECTEFFLLVAVHFHTKKTTAIVELVRSTLQLHMIFHTDSLSQIGVLITTQIFSEEDVAKRSIELSPVAQLSTKQSSSLTLSCIYHLLKSQIFIRYKVDIGDWVMSQVIIASLPIHHLLPAILEEFVISVLNRLKYGYIHEFRMNKISESDIHRVMNGSDFSMPQRVLLLYYLLYYNKQLIEIKTQEATKNMRPSQNSVQTMDQILANLEYSDELIDSFPIQSILYHVHEKPQRYENIYPPLLSLIVSQFPRYFLSENLLLQEDLSSSHHLQYVQYHYNINTKVIQEIFTAEDLDVTKAMTVISSIRHFDAEKLMKYIPIIMKRLIPFFLETQLEYYKLLQEFQLLWEKGYCANPTEIGLLTINLLRQANEKMVDSIQVEEDTSCIFTDMNIVNDPLIILRADSRTFTCPTLVQMLLHVLDSYMIASRSHLVTQAQVSPVGSTKQEELHTLLYAQDSALLQMLLEVCLSNRRENISKGVMEEINTLICGFLHAQFIKNPLLVKLIHFQGFHDSLIPILVEGVPSLHLCLEFVPELLSRPDHEQQLFAVRLGTELIKKYPLVSSIELGRLILNHIGASSASSSSVEFLTTALPCVQILCESFPALVEPSSQLLLDMKEDTCTKTKRQPIKAHVSCREVRYHPAVQATITKVFNQLSKQIC